jgi:cytidine deaminase
MESVSRFTLVEFSALSARYQLLFNLAAQARLGAQAPYSRYLVGSAAESETGRLYTGCNVERCTYTQTTHAEQAALDELAKNEPYAKVKLIVIVAAPAGVFFRLDAPLTGPALTRPDQLAAPSCGHCLQDIWENCHGDRSVPVANRQPNGQIMITTIGSLLPVPFGPQDLGIDFEALRQERQKEE